MGRGIEQSRKRWNMPAQLFLDKDHKVQYLVMKSTFAVIEVIKKVRTVCLTVLFLCSYLFAFEVPHSATPLFTPENMLGEMLRVDPEDAMPESFLYMVFSTRQTKYSEFEFTKPFGDFTKNSATAYVKVTVTI